MMASSDSHANDGSSEWGVSAVSLIPRGSKYKAPSQLKGWEWALIGVTLPSTLAALGLSVQRMLVFAPASLETLSSDFAFALVMGLNAAFCSYYVLSGVFRERRVELWALLGSVVVVLAYASLDYALRPQHRSALKAGRLGVSWLLGPLIAALALKVQASFGWLQFRRVGPAPGLQKVYNQRCIFYSLVAFDLQAVLSFFLLGLSAAAEQSVVETIVEEAVGVPFSLLWSLSAFHAVRWEVEWGCWAAGLGGLVMPAFVAAESLRIYWASSRSFLLSATALSGSLAVALRVVLFVEAARCARNFGQGLLRALEEAPPKTTHSVS